MDMTSFKGLGNYGFSLADFLGRGKSSAFDTVAQSMNDKLAKLQASVGTNVTDPTNGNVNITLSAEAQALLAKGNETSGSKVSGIQKGGQDFLMSFFDQNGVDFSELSDAALDIIVGLQDVIGGASVTQRDITTDALEGKYNNENRRAYTLLGNGTRLRVAIDYSEGKPQKLSVTDITNGKVETAEITLESKNGKVSSMTIERTQKTYQNGHMVSLNPIDPMMVSLY